MTFGLPSPIAIKSISAFAIAMGSGLRLRVTSPVSGSVSSTASTAESVIDLGLGLGSFESLIHFVLGTSRCQDQDSD